MRCGRCSSVLAVAVREQGYWSLHPTRRPSRLATVTAQAGPVAQDRDRMIAEVRSAIHAAQHHPDPATRRQAGDLAREWSAKLEQPARPPADVARRPKVTDADTAITGKRAAELPCRRCSKRRDKRVTYRPKLSAVFEQAERDGAVSL